jgi:hypothetical protein
MKTTNHPASITLQLNNEVHHLSLEEAKELVTLLQTEIRALEGPPKTFFPEKLWGEPKNKDKFYKDAPLVPPFIPYYYPDKNPHTPPIWCQTSTPT